MRGNKRGRPPSKPIVFRDGYYIEVRNKSTDPGSGVKIRKDTEEEMLSAIEQYKKSKIVVILGAFKNGKPVKEKEKDAPVAKKAKVASGKKKVAKKVKPASAKSKPSKGKGKTVKKKK